MLAALLAFTVIINGTPIPVTALNESGTVFIELQPVIRELGGSFEQYELTSGWRVELNDHNLVLGVDTHYVVLDGELKPLTHHPIIQNGLCYMPAGFYEDLLCSLIHGQCRLGSQILFMDTHISTSALLTDVQLHYLTGFTKVVLTFDQSLSFSVNREGESIRLVSQTPLELEVAIPRMEDPIVDRIFVDGRDVVVNLSTSDVRVSHYSLQQPFRVVLDISKEYRNKSDDPVVSEYRSPYAQSSSQFTVVIDPGHGGKDAGANDGRGLLEKELALKVAKKVERHLRRNHEFRVILTRTSDVDMDLDTRAAKANEVRAHVFVSIHANSAKISTAHGPEVYYLTLDSVDPSLKHLADDENLGLSGTGGLDFILWELSSSANSKDSAKLAELVAVNMAEYTGLPERGVKQAPFRVLMGATMPAVLVELGFLTNSRDRELLQKEEYLEKQAQAIASAVNMFHKEMGDRWYQK